MTLLKNAKREYLDVQILRSACRAPMRMLTNLFTS